MLCHAWNVFPCFRIKQATNRLHSMTAVIFLSTVPCPTSFHCCQYSFPYWLNCQFWKVIDNTLDSGRVELASTWEINANRSAPQDSAEPRSKALHQHGSYTQKKNQILHVKNMEAFSGQRIKACFHRKWFPKKKQIRHKVQTWRWSIQASSFQADSGHRKMPKQVPPVKMSHAHKAHPKRLILWPTPDSARLPGRLVVFFIAHSREEVSE